MPVQPGGALVISQILLWGAIPILGALVFVLVRQVGLLHERVGPVGALGIARAAAAGTPVPDLRITALDGTIVEPGAPRTDGRSRLFLFVSPSCPVCHVLLAVVRSIERDEADWLDVFYVSDGPDDAHAQFAARHRLSPARYLLSEALGRALGISRLPHAVLVAPDGTISAMGLVNNREHVESLFEAQARGVASLQEYLERASASVSPQDDRRTADVPT